MTPPPPVPFPPIRVGKLGRGRQLFRIHHRDFGSTAFNPGRGNATRFAPLLSPAAPAIPHAYAASSYECAAYETVFHEIPFDAPVKTIADNMLQPLMLSRVRCRRPLRLATLFEPDLNRWNVKRSMLIDTSASAYGKTVEWALAIHANSDVDGLIWTSKRCDPDMAMLFFGDRLSPDDLEEIESRSIASTNTLGKQLEAFAERAGIAIIRP